MINIGQLAQTPFLGPDGKSVSWQWLQLFQQLANIQTSSGSAGVASLNTLTGALDVTAGVGISIAAAGSTVQVTNTLTPGSGTVTEVDTTAPLTGGPITDSGTIAIPAADTSTDGYLTAADWNAFDAKGDGTVTSVGTSAPLTGGPIAATGTVGITQSDTSTDGYLSSTDWNTFNGKAPAGTYAVGPGSSTANDLVKFANTDGVTLADGGPIPQTIAALATKFLTSYTASTGAFTQAQPDFTDISGTIAASQLIAPTATTLGASYAATSWTSGPNYGAAGNTGASSLVRFYSFYLDAITVASYLGFDVNTADNTANSYDLGLFGPGMEIGGATVPLACHTGTIAGSSFAAAAGVAVVPLTLTVTLLPGWYIFAYTSNAAGATFKLGLVNAANRRIPFTTSGVASIGGTTLPSTITAPTTSAANGNIAYVNLTSGF